MTGTTQTDELYYGFGGYTKNNSWGFPKNRLAGSSVAHRWRCCAAATISAKIAYAATAFFKENEKDEKNVMQDAVLGCFAATWFIGNYAEFNSLSVGLTAVFCCIT